jgi:hypothetical protein
MVAIRHRDKAEQTGSIGWREGAARSKEQLGVVFAVRENESPYAIDYKCFSMGVCELAKKCAGCGIENTDLAANPLPRSAVDDWPIRSWPERESLPKGPGGDRRGR